MTAEKFDFLMHFTHTTNKIFAYNFSFDTSYISLIRRGKRTFPTNIDFVSRASSFFAEQIRDEKLESSASIILNGGKEWPSDIEAAGRLIFVWSQSDADQAFINLQARFKSPDSQEACNLTDPRQSNPETNPLTPSDSTLTFLGSKGKRDAFLYAFEVLCSTRKSYEFLVYSDEALDWFTEDVSFFTVWKEYCMKLIRIGSSITLITYLNRSLKDLQAGLCMWLPLIATGAVKVYTCQMPNDSIFNRTLCIARAMLAISSSSLRMSASPSVNTLYTDRETVISLTAEFDTYLSLCVPLYRTYSQINGLELYELNKKFNAEPEDLFSISTSPALYSLPESLCDRLIQRTGCTELKSAAAEAATAFQRLMAGGFSVTSVLRLPLKKELLEGRIPLSLCPLYGASDLHYQPEEYLCHLENLLFLASDYPNFKLALYCGEWLPEHIDLELKQSAGAVIDITLEEEKIFYLTESSVLVSLRKLISFTAFSGDFLAMSKRTIRNYISEVRKLLNKEG